MARLRAVFFDAGETLLSAHPSFAEIFVLVMAEQGRSVDVGSVEEARAAVFEPIVSSGREGFEKPNPAIFHLAAERAGVAPEEAVYVGDHPRIDAAAAEAVGMASILIDRRGHHPSHEGPRVSSLADILP